VRPALLLVLATALAAGCSGDDASSDPDPAALENVPWALAAGIDVPGWETVAPSAAFDGERMSGFNGCNSYGAPYTVDGSALELGLITQTLIGCPAPASEVETDFGAALERVGRWRVEDGELALLDADDDELLRFRPATPDGSWTVTGFRRTDAVVSPVDGTTLTATFTDEGEIRGGAGCNTYRAPFTVDGAAIEISQPASTRKFCAEPDGVMEQEAAYLEALASASRFRLDGRALQLTRDDGTVAVTLTRAQR
jgi:heat shock protein HslJ